MLENTNKITTPTYQQLDTLKLMNNSNGESFVMRCDKCMHWERNQNFIDGECTIKLGIPVSFEVIAGWDGGVVDRVFTDEDFFCASFSENS